MAPMKAIRIHTYGGPEVLVYEDAPRPEPAGGELLVRVHAAGVNPVDWKVRDGQLRDFHPITFPFILGWDVAGTVEAVGPGALGFTPGDAVYALRDLSQQGAYAEYVTVKAENAALKPQSLDFIEAAAVPLASLTAWQALFDIAGLEAGHKVLIHGAAGGVGHFAVQLAKWRGAHVVGTASAKNHDFLKAMGAHEVVDYTADRFEDMARDVDVVLDTRSGDTRRRSWGLLKKGGILVSTLPPPPDRDPARPADVRGGFVFVRPDGKELTEIGALIDGGYLRPAVHTVFALTEARLAHEMSEGGHTRGKIVLKVKA